MSLIIAGSTSSVSLANPTAGLSAALQEFEGILTDEQKLIYRSNYNKPGTSDVIAFVSRIDAGNKGRAGKCFAPRLCGFLERTVQFTQSVDTFVQSNPAIAALVWGGVRTTILAASNYASYFDKITDIIMNIGRTSPTYLQFGELYPGNPRLQEALCEYYATIIHICIKIIQVLRRGAFTSALSPVFNPFELEFKKLLNQLAHNLKCIDIQASLASQKTIQDEAQLAEIERKESKVHRRILSKLNDDLRYESLQWRIEKTARQTAKKRTCINRMLCAIDHVMAWRQLKRQHLLGTANWFRGHDVFIKWSQSLKTSVLWCSGKMGSGKSVFVSNIIASLLDGTPPSIDSVSFFFCRTDEPASLQSRTIVGSICRQLLEERIAAMKMDELTEFEDKLHNATTLQVLRLLLEHLEKGKVHYIILDGLDECNTAEVAEISRILFQLRDQKHHHFRILCAARPELENSIFKSHEPIHQLKLSGKSISADIDTYIDATLERCLEEGGLVLGEPDLILSIRKALQAGADDMFLWVRLSIEEICLCNSDADIRIALDNLPRELSQIYDRRMGRVCDPQNSSLAPELLGLCCVARRPLTLDELREALTVKAGQKNLDKTRLSNDMARIVSACHGLVYIDEQDNTLLFIHHSVKQYLSKPRGNATPKLFDELDLDTRMGVICLTYLNFSDFERQVSKRYVKNAKLDPVAMTYVATSSKSQTTAKIAQKLLQWKGRPADSQAGTEKVGSQAIRNLAQLAERDGNQEVGYQFWEYARMHWFDHFNDIRSLQDLNAESLFIKHVDRRDFQIPTSAFRFPDRLSMFNSSAVCRYAFEHDHGTAIAVCIPLEKDLLSRNSLGDSARLLVYASSTENRHVRTALFNLLMAPIVRPEELGSLDHRSFVQLLLHKFDWGLPLPRSDLLGETFIEEAFENAVRSGSMSMVRDLIGNDYAHFESVDYERMFMTCLNEKDFAMARAVWEKLELIGTPNEIVSAKNSHLIRENTCISDMALKILIDPLATRATNLAQLSKSDLSWLSWATWIGNVALIRKMLGTQLLNISLHQINRPGNPFLTALASLNFELIEFFLIGNNALTHNLENVRLDRAILMTEPAIKGSVVLSFFDIDPDMISSNKGGWAHASSEWQVYRDESCLEHTISCGLYRATTWMLAHKATFPTASKLHLILLVVEREDTMMLRLLVFTGQWLLYDGPSKGYEESQMRQLHCDILSREATNVAPAKPSRSASLWSRRMDMSRTIQAGIVRGIDEDDWEALRLEFVCDRWGRELEPYHYLDSFSWRKDEV